MLLIARAEYVPVCSAFFAPVEVAALRVLESKGTLRESISVFKAYDLS